MLIGQILWATTHPPTHNFRACHGRLRVWFVLILCKIKDLKQSVKQDALCCIFNFKPKWELFVYYSNYLNSKIQIVLFGIRYLNISQKPNIFGIQYSVCFDYS